MVLPNVCLVSIFLIIKKNILKLEIFISTRCVTSEGYNPGHDSRLGALHFSAAGVPRSGEPGRDGRDQPRPETTRAHRKGMRNHQLINTRQMYK